MKLDSHFLLSYQGFPAFGLLRHKFSNFLIFDHKQLQAPLFEPAAATDSAGILFIKGVLRFIWCFVLVGAMRTPFVVELHIFGNPFLEFVFRPVGAPVQFFLLQSGEEGLHYPGVSINPAYHFPYAVVAITSSQRADTARPVCS